MHQVGDCGRLGSGASDAVYRVAHAERGRHPPRTAIPGREELGVAVFAARAVTVPIGVTITAT